MKTKHLSACFFTNKIENCKEFYIKYFDAKVAFDCGWYVILAVGGKKDILIAFMKPQDNSPLFNGKGVTLNFEVTNVDDEYIRLKDLGAHIAKGIKDNPWGDRSFTITDPVGINLCVFTEIKPTPEYEMAYLWGTF